MSGSKSNFCIGRSRGSQLTFRPNVVLTFPFYRGATEATSSRYNKFIVNIERIISIGESIKGTKASMTYI